MMRFPGFVYLSRVDKNLSAHPWCTIPMSTVYWKLLRPICDKFRPKSDCTGKPAYLDLQWLQCLMLVFLQQRSYNINLVNPKFNVKNEVLAEIFYFFFCRIICWWNSVILACDRATNFICNIFLKFICTSVNAVYISFKGSLWLYLIHYKVRKDWSNR